MAKDKPAPPGKEDIFGSGSLLERLGRGKSVVESGPSPAAEGGAGAKAPRDQRSKAPKRQSAKETDTGGKTIKVSVYLTEPDLEALDQQVITSRRRAGRKKDRSELIREAVRFWLKSQR